MLTSLKIAGYRSVVTADLKLAPVTVVLGANGTGKSNLYRSLVLLSAAADGRLSAEFASEGGFASALWAGPRRKGPVRMSFAAEWDDLNYRLQLGLPETPANRSPTAGGRYTIELGLPQPGTPFPMDPVVKSEEVVNGGLVLAKRGNGRAFVRDEDGACQDYPCQLWDGESMLSQIVDPRRLPVLFTVRERCRAWRNYHQFRTDAAAPARLPRSGHFTPVLGSSGDDLAAALHTVNAIGRGAELADAIERALPGCRVGVEIDDRGQFLLKLTRTGLSRPLSAGELSDGTLRYLCLAVALFSPRPPELMAINEPETSLHPELVTPLAELMLAASVHTQLWVTTHSRKLAQALTGNPRALLHEIELSQGQTRVRGAHPLGLRK